MKSIIAILILLLCATAVVAEDNVMTIGDVQLFPGESTEIPVMIIGATDVAGGQVDITYDPAVITITDVIDGDYEWTMSNLEVSLVSIRIVTLSLTDGLSGDVRMGTLKVTAIGQIGDVSPLSMSAICLSDPNATEISPSVRDGSVEIISDNIAPVITDTTTMEFAPGGNGMIGVAAADPDGNITSVTFDLTAVGLGVNEYTSTFAGNYVCEFQMPADVLPGTYDVLVTVTDDDGAIDTATISVTVIIMGDVNGDGDVTAEDAILVLRYIVSPDTTSIDVTLADVVADGVINVRDAVHILRMASGNPGE